MASKSVGGHVHGLFATNRTDNWWLGPALTVLGLGFFILYNTWAGWQAEYYSAGPYLSPAYAPLLFVYEGARGAAPVEHALFGAWPGWWPEFLPKSPNFLIVLAPVAFRGTCYYYRKAYYRAFFGMPPGCAVEGVPHNYQGETALLVFQNLHRYTLYVALLFIPFLWLEAFNSFFYEGQIGIGLGSVFLVGNAYLLTMYTLGCHAWRHLVGGRLNCFSCDGGADLQHKAWSFTTMLNQRHMLFAWTSLYWFLCSDVYIRLVSMNIIPDVNTWHGVTWVGDF